MLRYLDAQVQTICDDQESLLTLLEKPYDDGDDESGFEGVMVVVMVMMLMVMTVMVMG